ncbi:hypothetical protein GA0070612_3428 [Micromonospora chokoriensis]|uniref:Uncharacterized protein n=1 Tax=Micromonospora chokoriensis TaxID=356851 RepID=A0A1C4XCA5_9ACTN|nr:hypothetical protein GA0070612_3428 [Micromonospora chokoriensis]
MRARRRPEKGAGGRDVALPTIKKITRRRRNE